MMASLRHRTFVGPKVYVQGVSLNQNREVIRILAQEFAAAVGVDNVVSVTEHAMTFGPFTVVVWYRAEGADEGGSVVEVSNAVIAARLRGEPASPADGEPAPEATPGAGAVVWALLVVALAALLAVLAG